MTRPGSTSPDLAASEKTIVCAGCTLLCDDIEQADGRWQNACPKGLAWFNEIASRDSKPTYRIGNKIVSRNQALDRARQILANAQSPLVCGLDRIGWQAQAAAIRLAIQCRAKIDIRISPNDRAAANALAREGWVTATLGEIRNRSQGIVLWFADPSQTHPRLCERCQLEEKTVFHIGPNNIAQDPNHHWIELSPSQTANTLAVWEMLTLNEELDNERVLRETGHPAPFWRDLLNQLSRLSHLTWFVSDEEDEISLGRLCRLIRQWNRTQRVWLVGLRRDRNGLSAENILTAMTGFPYAVDLSTGVPRFNDNEFSAERQLATGAIDAGLCFGALDWRDAEAARQTWNQIPKIVFSHSLEPLEKGSANNDSLEIDPNTVSIIAPGIERGDWARFDDLLLPVQPRAADTVQSFLESLISPKICSTNGKT